MTTNVFDRRTTPVSPSQLLSAARYNLVIGTVLLWGFVINWLMVGLIPVEAIRAIHPLLFMLLYFGLCLMGILLLKDSADPGRSFLGYNLIVLPVGLVINLAVSQYAPGLVLDVLQTTGLVTLLMLALGTAFPQVFAHLGGTLFSALLAVIVIEWLGGSVFGFHSDLLDWGVALIFCGYIGYDWGRANRIPKTAENAIECAAALYLDLINLFLRLLSLFGDRDSSD